MLNSIRKLNLRKLLLTSFLMGTMMATASVFAWGDDFETEGWSCLGTTTCNASGSCSTPIGNSTPTCSGTTNGGGSCLISCVNTGGSF